MSATQPAAVRTARRPDEVSRQAPSQTRGEVPSILHDILLASLVVTLAFTVKGLTGFGSGLLMVPLLALFLDVKGVVPLAVVFGVLANLVLLFTFQTRRHVVLRLLPAMVAGGAVGVAMGTYVLASYRSDLLATLCGLFIAAYAAARLLGRLTGTALPQGYGGLAGFLSGLIGGMFGTGGPPAVMYLSRQLTDKRAFRGTLTVFFLSMDAWQVATLRYAGLLDASVLRFIAMLLPAFLVGNLLGSLLHIRIPQRLFDRAVAVILLVTGLALAF